MEFVCARSLHYFEPNRPLRTRVSDSASQILHAIRDLELASGGPSRSIPQLVMAIDSAAHGDGLKQHVVYGDRGNANATISTSSRVAVHGMRSASSFAAFNALATCADRLHSSQPISLLHVHGLWSPELHRVMRWARGQKLPYVVSPRGMLSEWCINHKRLKKRLGWLLYQSNDLKKASAIHATSDDERNDVRRMGIETPTFVVPNGMQVVENLRQPRPATEARVALCITRLHPVKGLELLIEAWDNLQLPNWKLVIAGPSEAGMREKLETQIQRSKSQRMIELKGEVDGPAKQTLLDSADLFVLPSFSENFGMAIAESLAHGLPVITTTGTPWSVIVSNRCGWFVAPNVSELQRALQEATGSSPETLIEMGQRGQALMHEIIRGTQ